MTVLTNKLLRAMESVNDSHFFDLLGLVYARLIELENGIVKMDSAFRTNPITGDKTGYTILQALLREVPLDDLALTGLEQKLVKSIKEFYWFQCLNCDPTPIRVSMLDYLAADQKCYCPHCKELCVEIEEPEFFRCS